MFHKDAQRGFLFVPFSKYYKLLLQHFLLDMLSEGEGGTYCLGGINAVQITFKDFMNLRRSCVALDWVKILSSI